jgi:hypothetical protein
MPEPQLQPLNSPVQDQPFVVAFVDVLGWSNLTDGATAEFLSQLKVDVAHAAKGVIWPSGILNLGSRWRRTSTQTRY